MYSLELYFLHSIKNYNRPKSFPFQLYNCKPTGVKLCFLTHEESFTVPLNHTDTDRWADRQTDWLTDLEGWDGAQNESSRGDDHKSYWYHSNHLKHNRVGHYYIAHCSVEKGGGFMFRNDRVCCMSSSDKFLILPVLINIFMHLSCFSRLSLLSYPFSYMIYLKYFLLLSTSLPST